MEKREKTPKVWFTRPDYEFLVAPQRTKKSVWCSIKDYKAFYCLKANYFSR